MKASSSWAGFVPAGIVVFALSVGALPAQAERIHVDDDADPGGDGTTWPTAFKYLQDALAVANPADEIRVGQGIYQPDRDGDHPDGTGNRLATFQLISGVALYGGYRGLSGGGDPDDRDIVAYETILSGDLAGNDGPDFQNNDENSYHVVQANAVNDTAILDGFTVTGGNADAGWGDDSYGGGIFLYNAMPMIGNCVLMANRGRGGGAVYNVYYGGAFDSEPVFGNCRFEGNDAWAWGAGYGGGGAIKNVGGNPTLAACAFVGNTSGDPGGAIHTRERTGASHPTILIDCMFSDNSSESYGGALYCDGGPSLTGCTFAGNSARAWGGGLYASGNEYSRILLAGCWFIQNSVTTTGWGEGGGGMSVGDGSALLTNCGFVGNAALGPLNYGRGGGFMATWCASSLINCVFSGNTATGDGGAVDVATGYPGVTLTNCTLANNHAGAIGGGVHVYSDPVYLTNCILWGNSQDDPSPFCYGGSQLCGPVTVNYSCIEGGAAPAGDGNISADPLFIDPDGADDILGTEDDDLRLPVGSACNDAGDNEADTNLANPGLDPLPDYDFDGNARFYDDLETDDTGNGTAPIVDMGAFEFQDCNGNGIPDGDDIDSGYSYDCNYNGIPDECEDIEFVDCNNNGVPDHCDIAYGTSGDCNDNGVPDECDVDPSDPDGNGEVSEDCNSNGIPDECDLDPSDPDGNGQVSEDCNSNGIPDECDIDPSDPDGNGQVSDDCNENSIPDECEFQMADMIFIIDTSGSMDDDLAALCQALPLAVEDLRDSMFDLQTLVLAIETGDLSECVDSTVTDLFGTEVPGWHEPLDACGAGDPNRENWGPAIAVVAHNAHNLDNPDFWRDGAARLIMPISDEGPHCGCDITQNDWDSIDNAVRYVRLNSAHAYPVLGNAPQCTVEPLMVQLKTDTCGAMTDLVGLNEVEEMRDALKAAIENAVETHADCNGNGVLDECDILEGESDDVNNNGIPDDCECIGDLDGDWDVDGNDLGVLLAAWGACIDDPNYNRYADINGDGCVDHADFGILLGNWGQTCSCD